MRRIAAFLALILLIPPARSVASQVDLVLIEKAERRLTLVKDGKAVRTYHVALGANPIGPKFAQGDGKTPEGRYVIDSRNSSSGFHLALHISYPNDHDRKVAEDHGARPGGDIMIHGLKDGLGWLGSVHTLSDWTKGCIAVTNNEMDEIWSMVVDGTPVEIQP